MLSGALDYFRGLREFTSILTVLTKPIIEAVEDLQIEDDGLVTDAEDDLTPVQRAKLRKLQKLIVEQENKYNRAVDEADFRRVASRAANRTDKLNKEQVKRQLNAVRRGAVGVTKFEDADTKKTRRAFTRTNVSLISTIGPEHFNKIEKLIGNGFREGMSSKTLSKELKKIPGVTRRRAALIARDQIGSLNSNFTKQRHQENGITKFTWQTVEDERVRPEHADIDGREYSYKAGAPGEGFPGEPIQCRCYPEPAL